MKQSYDDLKSDCDTWHQLVHDMGSELPDSLGTPIHCERRGLVAQTKELREERDALKAEVDGWVKKVESWDQTHGEFGLLTRAISLSGATEDSDWAGLLEHVGGQGQDREKLAAESKRTERLEASMRQRATLINDACAELPGDVNWFGDFGLVAQLRKLRERAEAAESERERWQEIAHRDHKTRCNKYRERAEAAEALAAEMKAKSTAAHAKIFMLETTANLTSSKKATPTQTDLSRIAAALEVIADAH